MAIEFDSLMGLLDAGGTVMWILAALSVIALAIVLDRLWAFLRAGVWRQKAVQRALQAWEAGRGEAALAELEGDRGPLADVLRNAIAGRMQQDLDDAVVREEVARRGAAWLESLRGGLRPLELIGTLAPLLGLLGTVIGMIDAFQALESAGSQVDPAVLSGGIWVALLTTAAGLSVAIPAVAAHSLLERKLERLHHRMQDAATRVFSYQGAVAPMPRSGASAAAEEPSERGGQTGVAHLAEAAGAD